MLSEKIVVKSLWLLKNTEIDAYFFIPRPSINPMIHKASFVACSNPMYSASVDDIAVVDYNLLFQLILPPLNMYTYPAVDLLLSLSPAYPESEYPTRLTVFFRP